MFLLKPITLAPSCHIQSSKPCPGSNFQPLGPRGLSWKSSLQPLPEHSHHASVPSFPTSPGKNPGMAGGDGGWQLLPSPEDDLWHWVVVGCPVAPVQSCCCVILQPAKSLPLPVLPTGRRCYLVTLELCWVSWEEEGACWIWLTGQVKEQPIMVLVETSPFFLPHSRQRGRISMCSFQIVPRRARDFFLTWPCPGEQGCAVTTA